MSVEHKEVLPSPNVAAGRNIPSLQELVSTQFLDEGDLNVLLGGDGPEIASVLSIPTSYSILKLVEFLLRNKNALETKQPKVEFNSINSLKLDGYNLSNEDIVEISTFFPKLTHVDLGDGNISNGR